VGHSRVGIAEWRLAHRDIFKAKNGEMLSYLDFAEKLGILTPNYTTPYIITLVDLEESGPFVIEIPPGQMAGMIMDCWQRVLADLGVVGPDAGKGGKYLSPPPGHEKVAPEGYYVVQSEGRTVFVGVRLIDADREKAIRELIPGIKTYKWSPSGTGEDSARAPSRLPQSCAPTSPSTGSVEAFGIRTLHRNCVACRRKLSLNPAPEFNRIMNCQRPANVNGERCGINPGKNNESRRYG
jgi:hypothetical protein